MSKHSSQANYTCRTDDCGAARASYPQFISTHTHTQRAGRVVSPPCNAPEPAWLSPVGTPLFTEKVVLSQILHSDNRRTALLFASEHWKFKNVFNSMFYMWLASLSSIAEFQKITKRHRDFASKIYFCVEWLHKNIYKSKEINTSNSCTEVLISLSINPLQTYFYFWKGLNYEIWDFLSYLHFSFFL